jgi:(S)-ureidoglycine aminohydrolase
MKPKLGLTRTIVRPHYALIARDGYVASTLPGWSDCKAYVLVSSAIGAHLLQLVIHCESRGRGSLPAGEMESFVYVIKGAGILNGGPLGAGGFAYVPAGTALDFVCKEAATQLLIFQKRYEALPGIASPDLLVGNEADVPETAFLGDPHARLKTLLPETPAADLAVNIFIYDPGATLPFVETHVMEHGMLFLSGSGVYRLGEDWHPVTADDAIWIAPYCPQWFIAAGPEPARYIYYKDVNRMPA